MLNDCITQLLTNKQITKKVADSLRIDADNLTSKYIKDGVESPRVKAENDAINNYQRQKQVEAYNIAHSVQSFEAAKTNILNHPHGSDAGLAALLRTDTTATSSYASIDSLHYGYRNLALSKLGDFITKMKASNGFLQWDTYLQSQKTALNDMVKALYNPETASFPESKEFAKIYTNVINNMADNLAQYGLDYKTAILPFKSSYEKLNKVTKEQFVSDMLPLLDTNKIIDAPQRLNDYYNIRKTNGLKTSNFESKIFENNKTSLSNFMLSENSLPFKDGDSFLKANELYSDHDPYSLMISHIDDLALKRSLIETLGTNYRSNFNKLNEIALENKTSNYSLKNPLTPNKAMFESLIHTTNDPYQNSLALKNLISAGKNLAVASKLTSTVLNSLADQAFINAHSELFGMSYKNVFSQVMKSMANNEINDQSSAALGIIVDDFIHNATAARMSVVDGTGYLSKVTGQMADWVTKTGLLNWWTKNGYKGMEWAMNMELALSKDVEYADLPFKNAIELKNNGILEAEWNSIKKGIINTNGVNFIDPNQIPDQTAAAKLLGMIHSVSRRAVPTPDLEMKVTLQGGQPGNTVGSVVSGLSTFKGFALTTTTNSLRELLYHPALGDVRTRALWFAKLLTYGTLLGGLSVQSDNLIKGKLFDPMMNKEFWINAIDKAGTAGMFQTLFHNANTPEAIAKTIVGPVASSLFELLSLGYVGGATIFGKTKAKDLNKAAIQFLEYNTPGQIWPVKLVIERLVWNSLQKLADPKQASAWARQQQREKQDPGVTEWWPKGHLLPGGQ